LSVRRLSFLLSLIAALSATPLRQAEAAHDLACSLAELVGGDTIEETDGGIGDDSDATILSKMSLASLDLAISGPAPAPTFQTPAHYSPIFPRVEGRAISPPPRSSTRQALIQCFLF
jgi:hypothetical protein